MRNYILLVLLATAGIAPAADIRIYAARSLVGKVDAWAFNDYGDIVDPAAGPAVLFTAAQVSAATNSADVVAAATAADEAASWKQIGIKELVEAVNAQAAAGDKAPITITDLKEIKDANDVADSAVDAEVLKP